MITTNNTINDNNNNDNKAGAWTGSQERQGASARACVGTFRGPNGLCQKWCEYRIPPGAPKLFDALILMDNYMQNKH